MTIFKLFSVLLLMLISLDVIARSRLLCEESSSVEIAARYINSNVNNSEVLSELKVITQNNKVSVCAIATS